MKTSSIETILGGLILLVAVVFLTYGIKAGSASQVNGYTINARFNQIGSLSEGDAVRISGVKVGDVKAISLAKDDYMANVALTIDDAVKIPADSAASVASSGLLGGNYLDISPGGDEEMIQPNGAIQYTQDAQNFEKLLGQFIFSSAGGKSDETNKDEDAPAPSGSTPASPTSDL